MSQNTQILTHLKTIGPITQLDALCLYGCMRLASRIEELRCRGYSIITVMVEKGGKRFASYRLVKKSTNRKKRLPHE